MTGRALSFGAAAAAYERHRPGYPETLVDLVLSYADRPLATALEIGAGTGKATRVLAGRGIAVTASEPDPAMLAELRRHVPDSVTPVLAAFEDLPAAPTYDLVYAAAALHWTTPEGRWERIAALLAPGGTFTSFGGQLHLADPAVQAAVEQARAPYLAGDDVPSPDGTPESAAMQWPGTELTTSPLFTDVRQETLPRRITMSGADYASHLGTISAYLELPDDTRAAALAAVRSALPDSVELVGDVVVHLARLAHA